MVVTILFCKLLLFLAVMTRTTVTNYSFWYSMSGNDGLDMSDDIVGSCIREQSNFRVVGITVYYQHIAVPL